MSARIFRAPVASDVLSRATRAPLGRLSASLPDGYFVGRVSSDEPYLLQIHWPGADQETEDPYTFGLLLSDTDLHLFNEGRLFRLAFTLGANPMTVDGVAGTRFAMWAPNARAVSVIGDFNSWDARRHPMRMRLGAGVWELFVPRVGSGTVYKYALIGPDGNHLAGEGANPLRQGYGMSAGDGICRVWH